ncbi:MAG: 30S ribosomal protein S20 [Parcubacteria group bacterium]
MPIKQNAKKYMRASAKRKGQNQKTKKAFRSAVKKTMELVSASKFDEAKEALKSAVKAIDKAAQKKAIEKNTAARKKSRLMKIINKASKK